MPDAKVVNRIQKDAGNIAIATNNLILVTRNVADFADFDGLTIENWFGDSI